MLCLSICYVFVTMVTAVWTWIMFMTNLDITVAEVYSAVTFTHWGCASIFITFLLCSNPCAFLVTNSRRLFTLPFQNTKKKTWCSVLTESFSSVEVFHCMKMLAKDLKSDKIRSSNILLLDTPDKVYNGTLVLCSMSSGSIPQHPWSVTRETDDED